MRIREIQTKQKLERIYASILPLSFPAMSLLKCFLNKFVYSQRETFQTDLFGDAFNYCHVSSHPATHKLNGMYTHISLLTSPPDIFPSIPILNTPCSSHFLLKFSPPIFPFQFLFLPLNYSLPLYSQIVFILEITSCGTLLFFHSFSIITSRKKSLY